MGEVIKEFLVESNEGLDRFDRDLIALEKDRTSRELLDSIFRAIHTIKGTGGVLGFEKLVSVSHLGESVLSRCGTALSCFRLQSQPPCWPWLIPSPHAGEDLPLAGREEGDEECSELVCW